MAAAPQAQHQKSHSSDSDDETTPLLKQQPDKEEDKQQTNPVSLRQLFRYAEAADWLLIALGSLLAAAHGCGWPLISIIFGQMTNDFIQQDTVNSSIPLPWANDTDFDFIENMNRYSIQYAIIGAAVLVVSTGQVFCWALACERQVHRLRLVFFRSVLHQDMYWYDSQASGALTTRLADDLEKIRDGIGDKTSTLPQAVAGCICGFTVGFVKSWRMTLVMMSLTPLLAIGGGVMGKMISSMTSKEQKAYAAAGAVAEEAVGCVRTVVAFGGEKEERQRYAAELRRSMRQGISRSIVTGSGIGFVLLVLYSAYCLAFWYGATQVREWQESLGQEGLAPGDIFTVFFCVLIGSFSLGMAGQPFAQLAAAQGAAGVVHEVVDRQPAISAAADGCGERPPRCRGDVELRNVSFSYPMRPDSAVLRGLSLKIGAGQTVALTGPSGCGKSSIVKLLLRFYDPLSGDVLLDGRDLRQLDVGWLREQIGVVSQEPVLFSCSVSDNVRLGREEATDAEVVAACRQANAHEFISRLPDGYATLVGERGAQLSGGQKQRVAIARALLRRPALLLLDEATSALDAESESVVQEALDKAGTAATTKVVIAHRLSTVRNADLILSINDGRVVEAGTHEELIKMGGQYQQLVALQDFAGESEVPQATEGEEGNGGVLINDGRSRAVSGGVGEDLEASVHFAGVGEKTAEEEAAEQKRLLAEAPGFWRILRLNAPEWPFLLLACVGSLLNGGSMPVFALLFSEIIKVFAKVGDEMMREATFWALMFLVMGGTQFLGNAFAGIGLGFSSERLTRRLRLQYFTALLRQDMSFFDDPENSVGAITTRLASEAAKVQGAAGVRLALPLQAVFAIGLGLGIAVWYGWKLALMILACVPFMAIAGFVHMAYQTRSQKATDRGSEMAGKTAAEAIENLPTVQSLCREATFFDRYSHYLQEPYRKRLVGTIFVGMTYGFSQAAVFFVYAAAFRFGAYLVDIGDMEANNVFKVFFSITFAGMMVGQTFSLIPDYAKARIAAGSILRLLHRQPLIDASPGVGDTPKEVAGDLQLVDVDFAYPQRPSLPVLKQLQLSIGRGRTVALVGVSGCGKSTVVSLLQRLYDPTGGRVQLDGRDLRQLNVGWLRRQVRIVSQEPTLFARSIADNIAFGLGDSPPTRAEVEAAGRLANVDEFARRLPEGYDTSVGERGAQLSGGQKQRVALARALITSPKVLLLDEATSALDTESESIVQAALDAARRGRTCLLIAHRLSTVQSADTIVVMEAGRVVEAGTHAELMARGGAYYGLATSAQRRGGHLLPPAAS